MAAVITETEMSQEGTKEHASAAVVREYCVLFADLPTAIALVEATAPVTFTTAAGSADRKNLQWRSLGAPDLWLFQVHYGSANAGGGLRPDQFTFRVMSVSAHITQSLATLQRWQPSDTAAAGTLLHVDAATNTVVYPGVDYSPVPTDVGKQIVIYDGTGWTPGVYTITGFTLASNWTLDRSPAAVSTVGGFWYMIGTAPDLFGAIGQSLDTVQGCDILVPRCEFTYSQEYDVIGDAEIRTFRALVGKRNNAPFRGYRTGELMYLGCEPTSPQGTLKNGTSFRYWNLAHNFAYEPHQTNVKIGTFTLPVVPAHSFVWAKYLAALAALPVAGNLLAQRPAYLYVEQVSNYTDFSVLGISL